MTQPDDLAFKIYQAIRDGSGDALNLGAFDRYHPFFQMPSFIETFEGRETIGTLEALRLTFDKVAQGLRDISATRMVRVCSVAQFGGPEAIRGVHDTRLVNDKGQVIEAYSGMCTLRLSDAQWRVGLS
ncbi:hypothetical protein KUL25_11015 [Rhodobacteraceae bacterium N5(2021)]|uniref:Uncharacterized protein n=1 Tax=Gymnodinialimonas phycosphaerae TaxID=2841589 RepID=A0A975TR68_9RHOB|nr:hypothetical protein [Gymnodinialimonas phycosphaerae]MBY4893295.1 hypothetical protein [Gymnodinialimonas phycosphaerae]